jgi:beta-xylosidase
MIHRFLIPGLIFCGVISAQEQKTENVVSSFVASDNPIIKHCFTADPTARVFNNRLYVYTSHDLPHSTYWDMVDWRLFSTGDLSTWTDHGIIFQLKGFRWAEKWAWAPDCVSANGKYYLFLPTDRARIGVAMSNNPEGPFQDTIGKPLIDAAKMENTGKEPIDPSVLIDDDGQAYLYFGARELKVVKLDSSLTKLNGVIKSVELLKSDKSKVPVAAPDTNPEKPEGFGEAPFAFKYNGKYYLMYSNGWGGGVATLVYAIGDNPFGPFVYQGKVMESVDGVTHHGSLVQFKGKWYVFYHTNELPNGNKHKRSVCADEITFDKVGRIIPVKATKKGITPIR